MRNLTLGRQLESRGLAATSHSSTCLPIPDHTALWAHSSVDSLTVRICCVWGPDRLRYRPRDNIGNKAGFLFFWSLLGDGERNGQ